MGLDEIMWEVAKLREQMGAEQAAHEAAVARSRANARANGRRSKYK